MSVEDIEAIRKVLALYGHVVDSRDWDSLGEVYAPDATFVSRGHEQAEGLEAIVEFLRTVPQPDQHTSTNHVIDFADDGNSATGKAKWFVVFADTRVAVGDYEDRYVKTEAGWRILSRASTTKVFIPAHAA